MSNAQGSIVLHLFPEQILKMVKYRRVVQTRHRLLQICSRLQQFRLKAFLDQWHVTAGLQQCRDMKFSIALLKRNSLLQVAADLQQSVNKHLWGKIISQNFRKLKFVVPCIQLYQRTLTIGVGITIQLNQTGLDQQRKYVVFVCSKAVESNLVKLEAPYSGTSPNGEWSLASPIMEGYWK